MKHVFFFLIGILPLFTIAQKENKSSLTIKQIMQGEGFIGNLPHSIQWLPDNNIIFNRDADNNRIDETYIYNLSTKRVTKLEEQIVADLPLNGVERNDASNKGYYVTDNSVRYWNRGEESSKSLIYQLKGINNVQTVNDTSCIYYQSGMNLFKFNLSSPEIIQVTNFKNGEEKKEGELSEQELYLKKQQMELFEVVQDSENRAAIRKNQKEKLTEELPLSIYKGSNYLHSIKISPNEKFVTFILSDYPETESTHIENYVTNTGHSKTINARPKVGRKDAIHKMGIYNLAKKELVFVSIDNLTGVMNKPDYLKLYNENDGVYDSPKNAIIHGPYFSIESEAVIEIKSYDNKDRWIALLNLENGNLQEIEHQHDEAWIGGPGISSWNEVPGNLGWMKDGKAIYFQSEVTGYSHLYTYNFEKNKKSQLTEGNFEIHDAKLSRDGTKFFISANKKHAGNREFYHFTIKSKKWTPILTADGNYEVEVSHDEKYLAYRYSFKNKPWEVFVTENKLENTPIQVTKSLNDEFNDYQWRSPEVIKFKAKDGAEVPARLYKPESENNNHAAVIFVHGAGYLQNAHNWWSGYYREYMFHNLLVDNGYTVLDIDYRASKGYGRDWRTGIYRYMGGKDLSDQVDGLKYLVEFCGVDSTRVGIYGGSYGGFISIMAMLTTDKFPCAAAIRSVTDWAHYNHEYTSNILNLPETDSIAYRRSSPIYFADNLKGKLLMLHGIVDDNVQYQDVVRLSQRFIELGKTNWNLIGYPVEPHGFKEPSSWTDEYSRIFNLFQENLVD